ncbi:RAD18 [[Candida] subhashii]|uniref:Postreplication repair E3 ubiquitin-protein ligase RAD18 n=1 Tax=[Candida] subhashii TaxID=561895 RepID=A0A8J5QGM4_9ASCO|nr:RAD18 [[Candida] subhashii]KAG7660821.1 RAD18 [[Candida] subhashii]
MSANPFTKHLGDVTDPTDFRNTRLPVLAELDVLERCYICKEFFRAPVSTTCNHTFCSQCIREYLITNNLCPLCKSEVFESNLRRDVLLEEIVTCYSKIRPHLLKLIKKDPIKDDERIEVVASTKKRQLEDVDIIEIASDDGASSDENKRMKMEPSSSDLQDIPSIPSSDDLVSCPVCEMQMSAEVLQNSHIDDCLNGKVPRRSITRITSKTKQSPRNSISSFFKPVSSTPVRSSPSPSPPTTLGNADYYFNETTKQTLETKRLSKLDFSSLTTPKLKEKLSALKLPTQGTRNQLELRYNQYFVLYNSNLDSNRPISDKILRQRLNQWELSHSAFNNQNGGLFRSRSSISNKSITDKNFSVKEWMDAYQQEFRELIKVAKKSAKRSRTERATVSSQQKEDVTEDSSSPGTSDTKNKSSFSGNRIFCGRK